MSAKKGSSYERQLAREFSLWFTHGENDSVFWRTPASGARATMRSKAGKETKNHYGDLLASDAIGQPLIDAFTIEIKRGYARSTIADLLDKPKKGKKQQYERWFERLEKNAKEAKSLSWLLIHKRDRREAICFLPFFDWTVFRFDIRNIDNMFPLRTTDITLSEKRKDREMNDRAIIGIPLPHFFETVKPESIVGWLADRKNK